MTSGENMANILLQHLVAELTKLWRGQESEIKRHNRRMRYAPR